MNAQPPYEALEKIFHEPNRLAILSALGGAEQGLSFGELKTLCRLTDGNLNRHLAVLEETGVIRIDKAFVDRKPRTTVHLTKQGLKRFNEYLEALTVVLETAKKGLPAAAPAAAGLTVSVGQKAPA